MNHSALSCLVSMLVCKKSLIAGVWNTTTCVSCECTKQKHKASIIMLEFILYLIKRDFLHRNHEMGLFWLDGVCVGGWMHGIPLRNVYVCVWRAEECERYTRPQEHCAECFNKAPCGHPVLLSCVCIVGEIQSTAMGGFTGKDSGCLVKHVLFTWLYKQHVWVIFHCKMKRKN